MNEIGLGEIYNIYIFLKMFILEEVFRVIGIFVSLWLMENKESCWYW